MFWVYKGWGKQSKKLMKKYQKQGCLQESPHCTVVNRLDCDSVLSKFKLQSCYYIHFQTNTEGRFEPHYPHSPAMD